MTGKFIIIEGDDGAGKTTFVNHLKMMHPEYLYSREPGGSAVSERVREILLSDEGKEIDPLTRFHLFWASRAENLKKVIVPGLERGRVVVTDRFDASTYAFQIWGDGEESLEPLFWKTRAEHLNGLEPCYIYFTVPTQVAEARRDARQEHNHFDLREREYRERVDRGYEAFFASRRVGGDIVTFNADLPKQDMLEIAYKLLRRVIG